MSHAKNVEAFEKLVGICTGYGGQYTAGSPNLRVENLLNLLTRAQAAVANVGNAKTSYENATNGREVVAKEISLLASRVLAELKSSGATSQTIDDARTVVRKIKGRLASGNAPTATPAGASAVAVVPEATSTRSRITGKDYANLAYHFDKLLQTISNEALYQPVEPELQVQGLSDKLKDLRTFNAAVANSNGALSQARRDRDALLYSGRGSMYKTALAVKQRAKAAFGYNSEAANAANHIRILKPYK